MEKGESLQDWSERAEPDLFTSLAVRTHVCLQVLPMVLQPQAFLSTLLCVLSYMYSTREGGGGRP